MRKCLFILIAAAFLMVSVVPAMAQDEGAVSISGNVRMETYWQTRDSTMMGIVNGFPSSSDTDLLWAVQPVTTNLNFNFKAGDISATVIGRPLDGAGAPGTGAFQSWEQWFATWNFGAGTLSAGNMMNPAWRPFSSLSIRVANAAWYGAIDAVKTGEQLQVAFPVGGGTLKIGAINPSSAFTNIAITTTVPVYGASAIDTDNVIPKIEASYDIKFGGLDLWLGLGWQKGTINFQTTTAQTSQDITSYLAGIYASYAFGPLSVNGNYWMMKNPQAYGYSGNPAPFNNPGLPSGAAIGAPPGNTLAVNNVYDAPTASIIDVDYYGFHISAGWKISDMLTLQAGYGYNNWQRNHLTNPALEVVDPEQDRSMYYINMPIFAAKGFTITPEIGVFDDGQIKSATTGINTKQGKTNYYGVTWNIRF